MFSFYFLFSFLIFRDDQFNFDINQTIVWYENFKLIVPGAPPQDIFCSATSPTTIKCSWSPPPQDRSNGRIVYYKIFFVEEGRSDSEADSVKLNATEFILDELKRWTEYKIWVLAGTSEWDVFFIIELITHISPALSKRFSCLLSNRCGRRAKIISNDGTNSRRR